MKAVTMYRPNTIQNALSDFDRYFESFFGDSMLAPATRIFNHVPAVDIRETEKAYALEMELPGFDEKDIEISVDGNSLSISSKREETRDANENDAKDKENNVSRDEGTWILRERRVNTFSRSFKLPENANPEEVSAEFKNGILSMEIQKRAEAQKRTIQIKAK
ncbi:MAG: Hsp20/alpha crystallin family protein [Treponema sp.]|nr:Hsp20/alpha crystallin family protein [Treponema sp.]